MRCRHDIYAQVCKNAEGRFRQEHKGYKRDYQRLSLSCLRVLQQQQVPRKHRLREMMACESPTISFEIEGGTIIESLAAESGA